jgi:hypothetical protein
MASPIAGVLAVVGGTAWLVKLALIVGNGGTNTTDGLVGVLFDVGGIAILLALVVRAWFGPIGRLRHRPVAVLAFAVGLFAAINLPIGLGWVLFGRTWMAEELGILLTAVAAIIVGVRWATVGWSGAVATASTT